MTLAQAENLQSRRYVLEYLDIESTSKNAMFEASGGVSVWAREIAPHQYPDGMHPAPE